jgi:hypothetical protein
MRTINHRAGQRVPRLASAVAMSITGCLLAFACQWQDQAPLIGAQLSLTPQIVTLSPTAPDGGALAGGLATQQVVTVYGVAPDALFTPAQGYHVDVCIGNICPHLLSLETANSIDATAEGSSTPVDSAATHGTTVISDEMDAAAIDYTQYIHLISNPLAGQAAAATIVPTCTQISPAEVHCVLDVNGTATFVIASSTQTDIFGDGIPITASSGEAPGAIANAIAYVGLPVPTGSTLFVPNVHIPAYTTSLPCSPSAQCSDPMLQRSVQSYVQVRSPQNASASGADATSGAAPSQDAAALSSLVVGSAVDVVLAVQALPSDAGGSGVAWLSTSSDCGQPNPFNTITVQTDLGSGTASFFVCADGTSGSYQLSAVAGGSYASNIGISSVSEITVDQQPARISSALAPCADINDADAGATVYTEVDAQTDADVSASADAQADARTGNAMAVGETTAIVQFEDCTGAPTVPITGATYYILGATAISAPLGSGSTACVSVPMSSNAVSLQISFCGTPVIVGGI